MPSNNHWPKITSNRCLLTDLHVGVLGGLDAALEAGALVLVALDVVEVRHEDGQLERDVRRGRLGRTTSQLQLSDGRQGIGPLWLRQQPVLV